MSVSRLRVALRPPLAQNPAEWKLILIGLLIALGSALASETNAFQSPDRRRTFEKRLQQEFQKTVVTANRELACKAIVRSYKPLLANEERNRATELNVEMRVLGPEQVEYSGGRFLISKQELRAKDVSQAIRKGQPVTVKKVELNDDELVFEIESTDKERAKLKFASATFPNWDVETFKESVLSYFFLIEKYEPLRLLDVEYRQAKRGVDRFAREFTSATSYREKGEKVHAILKLVETLNKNRERVNSMRSTKGESQDQVALAELESRWRTELVAVQQQEWQVEIASQIATLDSVDDWNKATTIKTQIETKLATEAEEFEKVQIYTTEERASLAGILSQYRTDLEAKVAAGKNRRLIALDESLREDEKQFQALLKTLKTAPETSNQSLENKTQVIDKTRALLQQMIDNRKQYGDLGGTSAGSKVSEWERQQNWLQQERKRLVQRANAAEVQRLDKQYGNLEFDYYRTKAKSSKAVLLGQLNRMISNREQAVALSSPKANQQLEKLKKERDSLQD